MALTPQGFMQAWDVEGKLIDEWDTYKCRHCGRHSRLGGKGMARYPFGTCKQCMGDICEGCYHDLTVGTGVCVVEEKRLRMMEGAINAAILRESRLKEYEAHCIRLRSA